MYINYVPMVRSFRLTYINIFPGKHPFVEESINLALAATEIQDDTPRPSVQLIIRKHPLSMPLFSSITFGLVEISSDLRDWYQFPVYQNALFSVRPSRATSSS
jgi:hypothetical protein